MSDEITCTHLPIDVVTPPIAAQGCETCLELGKRDWFHLRYCQTCGRVGCCDNSPGKHATAHYTAIEHPIIRSYEPGEDWFWCFVDGEGFFVDGAPAAASYEEDMRA
jgi:uncharacterized UBP type Zn finger protein